MCRERRKVLLWYSGAIVMHRGRQQGAAIHGGIDSKSLLANATCNTPRGFQLQPHLLLWVS